MHLLHDTQEVAAPYLLDIGIAITTSQQLAGEVGQLTTVSQPTDTTIAIEIGTQPYVVDTHHLDSMIQMLHSIQDGSLALFLQKPMIKRYLAHATLGGKGTHLVVGQVARMVTQGTSRTMTAYDRRL